MGEEGGEERGRKEKRGREGEREKIGEGERGKRELAWCVRLRKQLHS